MVSITEEINQRPDEPSSIMTVFLLSQSLRGALLDGRDIVKQLRSQHGLGLLETLCLGHACLCVSLFIPTMKGFERVVFRYETDGKIPGFSVEASSEGWVRGYLFEKSIPLDAPLESWDLAPFFDEGFLSVTRFKEGASAPITGSIPIKHKNIAQDLTEYFLQSEQTKTAIISSVKFGKTGEVDAAGALFLQALPDADESIIDAALADCENMESLAELLLQSENTDDCIQRLFSNLSPEILLSRSVQFHCPCTRGHFLERLRHLPPAELQAILDDPNQDDIEVVCTNCSSVYRYTKEEITALK